jgi:hypothetical protein
LEVGKYLPDGHLARKLIDVIWPVKEDGDEGGYGGVLAETMIEGRVAGAAAKILRASARVEAKQPCARRIVGCGSLFD